MDNSLIKNLHRDYHGEELNEKTILKNPIAQFELWFDEAMKAQLPEPNAMTLATSNVDCKPSARTVLLRGIEDGAFVFFSNYQSRKGKELYWNPYAALLFFWNEMHRQVRIEGRIEKISGEKSDEYFHSRPVGSQLGALVSPQSEVIENREWLDDRVRELDKEYSGKEIPRPEHWGGYKLIPNMIEFWQGRENRLHDRIRFTLHDTEWKMERLAP